MEMHLIKKFRYTYIYPAMTSGDTLFEQIQIAGIFTGIMFNLEIYSSFMICKMNSMLIPTYSMIPFWNDMCV